MLRLTVLGIHPNAIEISANKMEYCFLRQQNRESSNPPPVKNPYRQKLGTIISREQFISITLHNLLEQRLQKLLTQENYNNEEYLDYTIYTFYI